MNPWTEEWLRKMAGWRAVKQGRQWFDAGLVSQLSEDGETRRCRVGVGKSIRKVMVRVSGLHDITVGCGCRVNAETGEICAHGAALIWAVVMGQEQEDAADKVSDNEPAATENEPAPAIPLELEFSPRWLDEIAAGSLALKTRAVPDTDAGDADQRLADWIPGGPRTGTQLLRLSAADLPAFFSAIDGHPRVHITGRDGPPLLVTAHYGRLPVDMSPDPEADRIEIQWRGTAPGNRLCLIDKMPWLWSPDLDRLESPGIRIPGWGDREWHDIAGGQALGMSSTEALPLLDRATDLFDPEPGSWLDELHIETKQPRIEFELEGSMRSLDAKLFASYEEPQPTRRPLDGKSSAATTHLGWSTGMKSLLQGDAAAENRAVKRLIEAGFASTGGAGAEFRLLGEDEIASFVAGTLQELAQIWDVREGERWGRIAAGIDVIRPRIEIGDAGSGRPDTLRFELQFATDDGASIPNEKIRRLLATGRRRVPRAKGRVAAVSDADHDWLDECLRELDPQQESGGLLLDRVHEPYLWEIRKNLHQTLDASGSDSSASFPWDSFKHSFQSIASILRDYQWTGLEWLWERVTKWGSALLADDMGLGKTLQVLAFLRLWQKEREPGPALVICPTSVIGNWREQVAQFWPDCRLAVLHGAGRDAEFERLDDCDLAVASYGTVARDRALHLKRRYSAVVIDEASMIRNPRAEISKAVAKLQGAAKIALTGTPIENGVGDLWAIFRFLRPGYLGSHDSFKEHYEKPGKSGDPPPGTMRRLRCRIAPFLLRRRKEQVATELPPCIRSDQWCGLSTIQRATYRAILEEYGRRQLGKPRGEAAERMEMLTVLLRLRQLCCDPGLLEPVEDDEQNCGPEAVPKSGKLERCLELLQEARLNGRRVLVFSQFARILRRLRRILDSQDIESALLTGGTRDREAEIERFRAPDGPPVFLISLKAGGYGLNLTEADVVIHFDPWWNPAAEAQATDRAHRIGQTKPVNVYRLLTRGTVEEHVLRLQAGKDQLVDAVLNEDGQSAAGAISDEDLHGLLDSKPI